LGQRDDQAAVLSRPRDGRRRPGGHPLPDLRQRRAEGRADLEDHHLEDFPELVEGVGEVLGRLRVLAAHRQAETPGLGLEALDPGSAVGEHRQQVRARPAEEGHRDAGPAGGILDPRDRLGQQLELLLGRQAVEVLEPQAEVGQGVGLRGQPPPAAAASPPPRSAGMPSSRAGSGPSGPSWMSHAVSRRHENLLAARDRSA
jgi:hypothetical protein